jgi:hypothetical protein
MENLGRIRGGMTNVSHRKEKMEPFIASDRASGIFQEASDVLSIYWVGNIRLIVFLSNLRCMTDLRVNKMNNANAYQMHMREKAAGSSLYPQLTSMQTRLKGTCQSHCVCVCVYVASRRVVVLRRQRRYQEVYSTAATQACQAVGSIFYE